MASGHWRMMLVTRWGWLLRAHLGKLWEPSVADAQKHVVVADARKHVVVADAPDVVMSLAVILNAAETSDTSTLVDLKL